MLSVCGSNSLRLLSAARVLEKCLCNCMITASCGCSLRSAEPVYMCMRTTISYDVENALVFKVPCSDLEPARMTA